jgi:hypothetical protein
MTDNSIKVIQSIISGAILMVGLVLIVVYSNWQTALGLVLVLWMNNMDYKRKD